MSTGQRTRNSTGPGLDRSILSKKDKIHLSLYLIAQEFNTFLKYYQKNPEKNLNFDLIKQQLLDLKSCFKKNFEKYPRWTCGQGKMRQLCSLNLQLISFQRRLFDGEGDMAIHQSIDVRWEHCREDLTEILDELLVLFRKQ